MKRTLLALVAATGLAGGAARADEVDALGGKVMELDSKIHELDGQLKPPPEPGPEIGERRLIDAQVLYELKNYEAASIILFDVVEKYPTSSAYPEALFYLADSLYLKRDFLSSRRFFEKIVEVGPSNRRYQESLQRLIELSLHTGDYSPVDGYIAKLEGLSTEKQLPSVPYVKGKYFFFRQQYDKALEALKAIGPTHIYYFHALYFAGSSYVAMGGEKLNDAVQVFSTITKTEPKTDSQKLITELAHLALARIYLDQGQLTNAMDEYAKITSKGSRFNDSLYESAWVAIKGKDYVKARRSLDLLLLNAPDSPLAPEVKLLIGKLHIRQNEYGPATDQFIKTRDEYAPIQKILDDELVKAGAANAPQYFRDLIAKNLSKFDTAAILPPAVVKWVKDEQEVVRVSTLIGDVGELGKSLDESDEIVRRLEKALSGPARVNVFPELANARTKAVEIANEITQVKKSLGEREAQLIAPVVGGEKATLQQLGSERQALEGRLAQQPKKADAIQQEQVRARNAFNDIDKHVTEIQTQLNGLRDQLLAVRKLYQDKVDPSYPATPQTVETPKPEQKVELPYQQRLGELARRDGGLKGALEHARTRVDGLKSKVLQGEHVAQDLDGCTAEMQQMQADMDVLKRDIFEAASSIGVDDAEMRAAAQLKAQYDDVLKRQHAVVFEVRARLGAGDRTKAEQIESILERARGVEQKIDAFNAHIESILDVRLKDIQSALTDEKAHVAAYRSTLGGYAGESSDVGGGVIAENFKAVAQRFYDVVVRSDVGIIDVAWALKDSSTRESNRLVAERKRELKLLDDEFKEVLKEQP
jgi:tetratricopeptide (TPR) repeat protein